MVAPLIVHMGTLVPFKLIKKQYKSIIIAFSGIAVASVLILVIVPLFFDYASAVAGTGPLTGGTLAFVLTVEKLQELNLTHLVTIPALVIAIQKPIGMPLATFFLRKHAYHVKESIARGEFSEDSEKESVDD